MLKDTLINKIISQLTDSLPGQLGSLKTDFEQNCRNILQSTFTKLDLVTREEFDVQSKVLAKTRQKLTDLEAKLAALEIKANQHGN